MVLHFNYNCQLCKQNFNNCVSLTAHLKHKHKNEMSYETYYLKYMNTKSIPGECVICGMPTQFLNLNSGYKLTCSRKCGIQLNIRNQKIDNYAKAKITRSITLKNKFGITDENLEITSPFCIKEIRDKSIETWHENYGESIDNPFQVETIKKSIQKTMIKKYGGKTTMESKELKEKVQNTNKIVYGGISAMYSDEVRKKALNTLKNNFTIQDDITSPFCIKEICDKKEKTLLDRYGNSCYFKTENFKQKCKKTLNDNYNVNSVFEIKEVRTKMKRKIKYDNLWFDSKPELAYYIWLKDNNIRFEYHPTLLYYSYNDKLYPYEPDFKIFNTYIEIKGNHFFKDHDPNKEMICIYTKNKTEDQIKLANELAEAKHQYMLNNGIKIITNYDKYIHYVEHKYGKHYLNMLKEKSKSAV